MTYKMLERSILDVCLLLNQVPTPVSNITQANKPQRGKCNRSKGDKDSFCQPAAWLVIRSGMEQRLGNLVA